MLSHGRIYFPGIFPRLFSHSIKEENDRLCHWIDVNITEWASLVPFVGAVSLIVYMSVQTFKPKPPPQKSPVNLKIQKETPKVVNMVDIEDLGEKVTYCRCWRSKKFPLCDGSHNKHNEETGDNVGPLVLKRKS